MAREHVCAVVNEAM